MIFGEIVPKREADFTSPGAQVFAPPSGVSGSTIWRRGIVAVLLASLLCTEDHRAACPRLRGSGVIADSGVWSHFPFFYSAIIIAVRRNPVRVLARDKPPPGA